MTTSAQALLEAFFRDPFASFAELQAREDAADAAVAKAALEGGVDAFVVRRVADALVATLLVSAGGPDFAHRIIAIAVNAAQQFDDAAHETLRE